MLYVALSAGLRVLKVLAVKGELLLSGVMIAFTDYEGVKEIRRKEEPPSEREGRGSGNGCFSGQIINIRAFHFREARNLVESRPERRWGYIPSLPGHDTKNPRHAKVLSLFPHICLF